MEVLQEVIHREVLLQAHEAILQVQIVAHVQAAILQEVLLVRAVSLLVVQVVHHPVQVAAVAEVHVVAAEVEDKDREINVFSLN